jgi:hypothetical protein
MGGITVEVIRIINEIFMGMNKEKAVPLCKKKKEERPKKGK